MDKEVEDVRRFHQKFGILDSGTTPSMVTKRKLQERIECMQEELDEFKKAVAEQDFPEQADALIDLVYFAKGTAVMMGLPWSELWDDVQRANIDKVRGVGKRGHAVDMIKPEGWQPPKGASILLQAGFTPEVFMTDGVVDELKCVDDPHQKLNGIFNNFLKRTPAQIAEDIVGVQPMDPNLIKDLTDALTPKKESI